MFPSWKFYINLCGKLILPFVTTANNCTLLGCRKLFWSISFVYAASIQNIPENTLIIDYYWLQYLLPLSFCHTNQFYYYYLKSEKQMNIKEWRNVFMISCSKKCMRNLNWEDNAFMQCISFLLMQYNVFLDENVSQRLIQNTEQNYSWSEGFSY